MIKILTSPRVIGCGIAIPAVLATASLWDNNATAAFWSGLCVLLGVLIAIIMEFTDKCMSDLREYVAIMQGMSDLIVRQQAQIILMKGGKRDAVSQDRNAGRDHSAG